MNGNEESNQPQPQAETVSPSELLTIPQPPPEPAKESEITQAQTITPENLLTTPGTPAAALPAAKGKGNRKLEDYAGLNWTKSNADLARETGVSRQRIQQIRAELKDKNISAKPNRHIPPVTGSDVNADFSDIVQSEPAKVEVVKTVEDYQVLAETTFDMSVGLLTMTIGPEWQPRELRTPDGNIINEKVFVVDALKKYYAAKQMQDLPPGVLLGFAIISYAGPRFTEPNTKQKAKLGWQWFKVKAGSILSRFRRKKQSNITIVNNEEPEKGKSNEN